MDLEYELLCGKRTDSTLLYIISEKNLYVKNSSKNGVQRYVCYQKILRKDPNKKDEPMCSARANVKDSKCYRNNVPHSCHENYQHIHSDMLTGNQIKANCQQLREILGESARAINARKIFNQEIAK